MMTRIKQFSVRYPLLFLLLIVLGWYILGYIAGLLVGPVQPGPNRNLAPQMIRMLAMLVYFLLAAVLLWRAGWARGAGITRLGGWQIWLAALYILIYKIPTELYAYFDTAAFSAPLSSFFYLFPFYLRSIFESVSDRSTILTMFVFSLFYESVYRGIVLYAFALAWGKSRLGILVSAIASAILFGVMYLVDMLYFGASSEVMLLSRLSAVLSGIWLGALVLRWGSIWPGVILHTLMLLVPIIPTEFTHNLWVFDHKAAAVRLVLFELPLAIFGMWLLLRTPLRTGVEGTLAQEPSPPADGMPTDPLPGEQQP